jgi:hypothetical protein
MLTPSRSEDGADILRFVVPTGDGQVTAFISTSTCQSHHEWQDGQQTLGRFYQDHRRQFEGIVVRKVRAGARHPVVVMAGDL